MSAAELHEMGSFEGLPHEDQGAGVDREEMQDVIDEHIFDELLDYTREALKTVGFMRWGYDGLRKLELEEEWTEGVEELREEGVEFPELEAARSLSVQEEDVKGWVEDHLEEGPDGDYKLDFLQEEFIEGFEDRYDWRPDMVRAAVPFSGGIDSYVTAALTAEALRDMDVPTKLHLISFETGEADDEFLDLADGINDNGIDELRTSKDYSIPDIGDIIDSFEEKLEKLPEGETEGGIDQTNMRIIGELFQGYCEEKHFVAVYTTNLTEWLLGEFTSGLKGSFNPLLEFYNSEVFALADTDRLDVPEEVIERRPVNTGTGESKRYFSDTPDDISPREIFELLDPVLYAIDRADRRGEEVGGDRFYGELEEMGYDGEVLMYIVNRWSRNDHRRDNLYFPMENLTVTEQSRLPPEVQSSREDYMGVAQ